MEKSEFDFIEPV